MKITDIIRGVLDLVDATEAPAQPAPDAIAALAIAPDEPVMQIAMEPESPEPDLLAVIQQLAGLEAPEADCGVQTQYANEPSEVVAPVGAAFPGGDDMHSRKNPADIRTNAPSMYPGFQAEKR
jgi:hypothetical protein